MKKFLKSVIFFPVFFFAHTTMAQENEVDLLVEDLLKVAEDFSGPAAKGVAYQAGAGWFTSAKSLHPWELDFSVNVSTLFIPSEKKSSYIFSSDYSTFNILDKESARIPTAFGNGTDVIFEGEVYDRPFAFNAIEGIDKGVVPHPYAQVSVGFPMGTELSVRFLPNMKMDNVQINLYGVGLKHNLNQHINTLRFSKFQFAALAAYSKFNIEYSFLPVVIDVMAELEEIEVDANILLFQLITSKSFMNPDWEVFGALGFSTSHLEYLIHGGGIALDQINTELQTLNNDEIEIKGDFGVTYHTGSFLMNTMISVGEFYNLNIGLHYRL